MLEHYLAGIWPLLFKYGIGVFAIGAALVFAWFSPVFKKTALWIAAGIAIGLVCYNIGVSDGANRIQKQWDAALAAAIQRGEDARKDAERSITDAVPDELRNDPYNRDKR